MKDDYRNPDTIPAARLAPHLLPYLRQAKAEAPPGRGCEGGMYAKLARKSGVDRKTISRIVNGKRKSVRFRTADALLVAIGRPDLWLGPLADLYEAVRV